MKLTRMATAKDKAILRIFIELKQLKAELEKEEQNDSCKTRSIISEEMDGVSRISKAN